MAQKVKGFGFSRLDTIMETAEIEERSKLDYLNTASQHKQLASSDHIQDSEDAFEKIQQGATLRRKRIAKPSTQIRNRIEQKEHRRLTSQKGTLAEPLVIIRNGEKTRTDRVNNAKATQNKARKLCEMKQVEKLFPEFFPKRTSIYLGRQCDWNDDHRNNMKMVNEKVKQDPLIQSWLNLFGARPSI
ncbi:hypothetical protein ACROYT_G013334 [Oculina patagonica]